MTLACIPPEKELLKLLKRRETIFSRPTQSGLLRLSLGYADDPLIQLLHDKWATYASVTYKEDTLIQRTTTMEIVGMDKPGKQDDFI